MQAADCQRYGTAVVVLAPVSEAGLEIEIPVEGADLVAIARAADRRDESERRAVADDGSRSRPKNDCAAPRISTALALDELSADEDAALGPELVSEPLVPGRSFDAARRAERILGDAADVRERLNLA